MQHDMRVTARVIRVIIMGSMVQRQGGQVSYHAGGIVQSSKFQVNPLQRLAFRMAIDASIPDAKCLALPEALS